MKKANCNTRYFLLLLVVLITQPLLALHIKGGWMSYRYLGKDLAGNIQYQFTVKVYRDCGPQSPGQNDVAINITLYKNSDNSQESVFVASQTSNYTLRKTSFSSCISPVPDVCYVVLEYQGIVTVPPSPSGYTAAFQRCCRIGGIVNINPPSNNLGNTYSIQLPGTSGSSQFVENSSPLFAEKDTAVVCFNSSFTLDYSAFDADGDSLVYRFGPAQAGASSTSPAPTVASAPPYSQLPYASPYSFLNPFGTSITIDSKTGIISGLTPSTTGEYVVAVVIEEYRNGKKLAETRKELHVNVANCSTPDANLPIEAINCDDFTVQFQNGSLSSAITSYYWDFGVKNSSADTSVLSQPSFTYSDTGVYIVKLSVNRETPCGDSASMVVKVFPGFSPGFVSTGSCFSNPFDFRDTTSARYGAVNSWRWDFGNNAATNDTSIVKNPSYTYPQPGTYDISFRATSTKGCDKTVTVPLVVIDKPLLTLPFKDTLICSIDSLQLQAIGTGNFVWTPGTGRIINPNTASPVVYPLKTTTYQVTINDRGCVTSDTVRVNVLDFIKVDAGRDTIICRTDTISLSPITQGLSFRWSPANQLSDPDIKNPKVFTTDSVTTFVVIANLGKCQDRDSMKVFTIPYPLADAGPDTSICFGDEFVLRGIGDGNRFVWNGSPPPDNPNQQITTIQPLQTTTYYLSVFDNKGCPKPGLDTVIVNVAPRIVVNPGRDTSIVYGQILQLDATSNATVFQWKPANGLSGADILNPTLTIEQGTVPGNPEYIQYTFVGSTPAGCTDSASITIRVFSTGPSIFIPTAFTPNNDGLNDKLRPILAGMKELSFFKIYNRFGQIIFETTTAETGWDGTYKGKPQNGGTFVYQAQAVDFNGEVLRKTGSFILIR